MRIRILGSIALLWAAACAQAQVSTPKLGVARYSDHTVHPVYGLESNVLVNDQLLSEADASSFSDSGGLISIAGRIQLLYANGTAVGQYDSSEQSPILNIDGGLTTAVAWLPVHSSLVYWSGSAFIVAELAAGDLPGKITSVQLASPTTAKLLATDASGNVFTVNASLATKQITSVNVVPGIKGPAFLQSGFIVSHDANGLHVEAQNGAVRTLPLAAASVAFERMGTDWVHVSSTSTGQDWALHLNATALHLSQLPQPKASRRLAARPIESKQEAR